MDSVAYSPAGDSFSPPAQGSRKRSADGASDDLGGVKRAAVEALIVVRVVCPSDRSGSVIGKGGEVIKNIRESTGARVKMEEGPRNASERSIIISSPDPDPEGASSPAQEALIRIMQRIIEDDSGPEGPTVPEEVEFKMLVESHYTGIILGKGGANVNGIRNSTKCAVSIVAPGMRTPLATPEEDMIKISGNFEGVKQAANMIMRKIREGVQKGIRSSVTPGKAGRGAQRGAPSRPVDPSKNITTEYRLLVPDTRIGPIIGKGGEKLRNIRDAAHAEVKVDRVVAGCAERLVICSSVEPVHSDWCGAAEGIMMCADRMVADKVKAGEPATIRLLAPANQMGAVLGVKGATIRQLSTDTGCKVVVLPRTQTPPVGGSNDEVLQLDGSTEQVMHCLRFVTMMLRGIQIRQQGGLPESVPISYPPGAFALPSASAPPPAYQSSAPPSYGSQPPAYSSHYNHPPPSSNPGGYSSYSAPLPAPAPAPTYSHAPVQQTPDSYNQYGSSYGSYSQPPPQENYNSAPPPPQQQHSYGGPALYDPTQPSQPAADPYAYQPPPAQQQSYSTYSQLPPASAPASGTPAMGTLHNPTISSEGLAPGMLRYTMRLPPAMVGVLLGARGSNISSIRLSSGAKVKVHDGSANSDREVEMTGTPAQVSHAASMAQTLLTTGQLPAR